MPVRRGKILLLQLLLLQLCFYIPCSPGAQTQPPVAPQAADEDPDGSDVPPGPVLLLDLSFKSSGELIANASYPLTQGGASLDLKPVVQESIGCQLTDKKLFYPRPNFYSGTCYVSSSQSRFLRQGKILTAPLQSFCKTHDFDQLQIALNFPSTEIVESLPPAPSPAIPGLSGKKAGWLKKFARLNASYNWPVAEPMPAEIDYRFGFDPAAVSRSAIYLALALFAPLLL